MTNGLADVIAGGGLVSPARLTQYVHGLLKKAGWECPTANACRYDPALHGLPRRPAPPSIENDNPRKMASIYIPVSSSATRHFQSATQILSTALPCPLLNGDLPDVDRHPADRYPAGLPNDAPGGAAGERHVLPSSAAREILELLQNGTISFCEAPTVGDTTTSPAGQQEKSFTFMDLFAGIGGFRVALDKLGGRCVGSCELDPFARAIYERNFISGTTKSSPSDNSEEKHRVGWNHGYPAGQTYW